MNWISVKEALPEYKADILVAQLHKGKHYVFAGHLIRKNMWTDTRHAVSGITHWMPFPEPPEAR